MGASTIRLVVHGKVQGVGFRFAACQEASHCAVSGWVRNLPDGSVEIIAQGSSEALDRMTSWACRGPRHAVVDDVEVEKLTSSAEYHAFEIRR